MKRLIGVVILLGLSAACLEQNPCDAYVEYMCECHTESESECEALELTYEDPSPDVQEQCVIDLADQEEEDAETEECEITDTDV